MNDSNYKRGNRTQRDTSPTAVASIPNTGFDALIYRGLDSKTNRAVFHWKLARRNRAGDGYYATYRVDGVGGIVDMIFAMQYVCAKFALVDELDDALRSELQELAKRLGAMIVGIAIGDSVNGSAQTNPQQMDALSTAFASA